MIREGPRGFCVWVISLRRLREFWETHRRAEVPLRAWFAQTCAGEWTNFAERRATFPAADLVGSCTVFNIGGNNFRLVTRVFFASHKVYVLRVMTRAEYDREDWPRGCGCYQPHPPRKERRGRSTRRRKKP